MSLEVYMKSMMQIINFHVLLVVSKVIYAEGTVSPCAVQYKGVSLPMELIGLLKRFYLFFKKLGSHSQCFSLQLNLQVFENYFSIFALNCIIKLLKKGGIPSTYFVHGGSNILKEIFFDFQIYLSCIGIPFFVYKARNSQYPSEDGYEIAHRPSTNNNQFVKFWIRFHYTIK